MGAGGGGGGGRTGGFSSTSTTQFSATTSFSTRLNFRVRFLPKSIKLKMRSIKLWNVKTTLSSKNYDFKQGCLKFFPPGEGGEIKDSREGEGKEKGKRKEKGENVEGKGKKRG